MRNYASVSDIPHQIDIDDAWNRFAHHIVCISLSDLRKAIKSYKRGNRSQDSQRSLYYRMVEIFHFFQSSWYRTLTNVDQKLVCDKLREEINDALKNTRYKGPVTWPRTL